MATEKAASVVLAARGGRHCLGVIIPRLCFNCPLTDCTCTAPVTSEEKKWNSAGNLPKTSKAKTKIECHTVSITDNYITAKPAKSARRFTNYEKLLY